MQKKKLSAVLLTIFISVSLLFSACGSNAENKDKTGSNTVADATKSTTVPSTVSTTQQPESTKTEPAPIDYSTVKPNESGQVMVLMFHRFVMSADTVKGVANQQYTTTFDEFRKLLQTLYNDGFRLVNMNDYLNNNISVAAGFKPIVFTFDDGTDSQFNLVDDNGKLVANKESAVGIMEEFNKLHPDFGLKGTFYVNLGDTTFNGKGTLAERLKYLVDEGFEIGNHTMNHTVLNTVKTTDKIEEQIGGNQKIIDQLIPGYKMTTFALPEGAWPKGMKDYVAKGIYQGVDYDNKAIMLVGANPSYSPVSKSFNPLQTARIRVSGIKKDDMDLDWWLNKLPELDLYVSDGNPDTVAVPKAKESKVDQSKLNGKKLIAY
ncbi:MAG: polysaccharide deacetylase family protein [Bacillota bacterium]|nr:polysaccharide deacetylase family protein [Bacillota bacterium]